MTRLGDICNIYAGTGFPKKYQGIPRGKYPFYKVGDISKNVLAGNINMELADNYIDDLILKDIKGNIVPGKTIIFAKIGEAVKLNRRAITKCDCLIDNNVMGVKAKEEYIDTTYLYYYMTKVKLENLAESTTVPSVRRSLIEDLFIPLPDLALQKLIAQKLINVDMLITKHKQQLADIDLLVKSQFIEMFGDLISAPKYDSVELSSICKMITGGTPSSSHPEYYGGTIPFVSTPCLGKNYIDEKDTQNWITELGVENSSTHLIPTGSLMFGIRVGVGKSSINRCPMCTNQDIISITDVDDSKFNLLFIKSVLDQFATIYENNKRGATIKGITSSVVKATPVPNVSIELQNKYTSFVRQVDKSKFTVQQSLNELELLKKKLMQDYFG